MNTRTILAFACAGLFAATAISAPVGVTVNGIALDDGGSSNVGWNYVSPTLTLSGPGPFTLSGVNTTGVVRVVVPAGVTNVVTLSNLTLQVTVVASYPRAFALEQNANMSLFLAGTNTLISGNDCAALEIAAGGALFITNAPSDNAGALTAIGGSSGAGIGGRFKGMVGTVTINGGTVIATGGLQGAGIGGGYGGAGTVIINGGMVTATGGRRAAGIGGGAYSTSAVPVVIINGGMVTATGGEYSAGIGGGHKGAGGTVTISGGTVFAQGNDGGEDIGPGFEFEGTTSGPNTFTGGSIRLVNGGILPAPSNGAARVWCVTVPNLASNAAITVTGLAPYGVKDLFADNSGKLYLWLPNGNYSFAAGDMDYMANVNNADTTATPLPPPSPGLGMYLTFSSANAFTITPQTNSWNGRLYYSTNATNWSIFTTNGANAANNGSGAYRLYLCGSGNNRISEDSVNASGWTINASAPVACSGNIETLLDYTTVAAGGHPVMGAHCFANLFKEWTALTQAPALPATNMADGCYRFMFSGCTGLTNTPALPATNLASSCYLGMFQDCTGLTGAPLLQATTLATSCYGSMFRGCSGLTNAPALPAETLASYCYSYMFYGCTGLTQAPNLPATTLTNFCYGSMFRDCTGLRNAPALPAETLASYCYSYMFDGCSALANAPKLSATTLFDSCYTYMFRGCTNLTSAPKLSATTLAPYCYRYMFADCTSLTEAPELPAETLDTSCYEGMFNGCIGLTEAPELPATTLATNCYYSMFHGCTDLTRLLVLPATNLAKFCYRDMFKNCTGIKLSATGPGMPWSIPHNATTMTDWSLGMLVGTGGTFTNDPETGVIYYYSSYVPPLSDLCLSFSSANAFTITPQTNSWNGMLYYSTDVTNWSIFTTNGAPAANNGSGEYKLYLCGVGNTHVIVYSEDPDNPLSCWNLNAVSQVACTGNIETLLDYTTVAAGGHPVMTNYCFANLFNGWTALTQAPELPATTLAENCYKFMFSGCTGLTQAPALPATELTEGCYGSMFTECTGLTSAPTLSATELANVCYTDMFRGCTGLTQAPELPATTLAFLCYGQMFRGCTGLAQAPSLPATTLAPYCYLSMFSGCTGLTNAPVLPATNLAEDCYETMFKGCINLTAAPALPAANLPKACYYSMFEDCTGLTQAPALPAMNLADSCYGSMFFNCTGLTEASALPATTLATSCYNYMFAGCTGLTRLPVLPATNLAVNCYNSMFKGCTGIKLNTAGPGPEWGIPAGAAEAINWNLDMLLDTGGTFTNDPVIGTTYYYVPSVPAAPSGVSASDGTFTNKIKITWNVVDFATGYTVWRHTANNSAAATEIGSTTGTTYDDFATVAKTTYYYWVKATNAAGVSGFSASDSGWRAEPKPPKPAAPTGVAASDGAHTDKIRVTWKASAGAASYKVYRHTSNNPNAASLIGTSATTAYNDTTAKTELTYYYWVKAVNEGGVSGFSAFDTGYLGVVGPLVMVNGMVGNNIRIPANKPITVAATMMNLPAAYLRVPVDWWVAAYVHQDGLWFYFDTNFNLMPFDGNLANVRPAYQGPLFNVPPMALVENMVLPRGTYNIWFAVDYPMDGKIDLNGAVLLSVVTIVVEP
ncbi:MAG: leucine-rich repeat protein [Kiritimatiellia bacterium]